MTSRERWLAVLRRQAPDRVPTDYWTTDEAREKLKRHLRCADDGEIFTRLRIDRKILAEPEYVGPKIPENADVFGSGSRTRNTARENTESASSIPWRSTRALPRSRRATAGR